MSLTDKEFEKLYFAQTTLIGKIQLAIKENRYTIWERNPPNFSDEYLKPILSLPSNTQVEQKDRESGGVGVSKVLVLKYSGTVMGKSLSLYLKGYFAKREDGSVIFEFAIQSLKEN